MSDVLLALQAAADTTRAYGEFPVIGARGAVFGPSMWVYVGLFFFESFTLYLYYYGWERWKQGRSKVVHLGLGALLNVWGTIVMLIANSWLTYMMTPPRDITPTTDPASIKLWHAID